MEFIVGNIFSAYYKGLSRETFPEFRKILIHTRLSVTYYILADSHI